MILVLINFMVITKGAGRAAEVAACFIDAMPRKTDGDRCRSECWINH